jgi:NADH dehydrogenase [ubiquinone] 1 alpha subcomplex assembly factor 7
LVGSATPARGLARAMTVPDLSERLARHIRAHGPMTIAAFMAVALHDPKAGYYARRNPLGAAGDFVTAPEISQIFGELIGLWCADLWRLMGSPDPVILAELGPGRGTLMADFLRATRRVAGFREALRPYLIEASPLLRETQRQSLEDINPAWVSSFDEVPEGPLLLVANEFLDALPIRQLVRGRAHWAERMVGAGDSGRLDFADGPENPALALLVPAALRDAPPGAMVEICPAAATLAGEVAERLARHPGAALFIDYGYAEGSPGDTLTAIGAHRPENVLSRPGKVDLSAHVDFAAFAAAARDAGATVRGPVTQRAFLIALGATARLEALSRNASPAQSRAVESGLRRLIDPQEMGTLFKVLAVTSPGLPAPAGFGGERC